MAEGSTEQVVAHVRGLIERGALRPGDRLPAERDLALQIGVSRPTVRAGLRALAAMGVVQSRHGSGTYIPDGPPTLGSEPLSFLAALHGFTREEMYEARRILEVGAAGLAAERATPEQLAALAEEVASLFATMERSAALPRARHQLSSHARGRVRQSDRRVDRRDGLGPLLRAPAADGRARVGSRSARRRRNAPAHLPGGAIARRGSGAPRDARAPAEGELVPGAGADGRTGRDRGVRPTRPPAGRPRAGRRRGRAGTRTDGRHRSSICRAGRRSSWAARAASAGRWRSVWPTPARRRRHGPARGPGG